jgi:hypothetical protein
LTPLIRIDAAPPTPLTKCLQPVALTMSARRPPLAGLLPLCRLASRRLTARHATKWNALATDLFDRAFGFRIMDTIAWNYNTEFRIDI